MGADRVESAVEASRLPSYDPELGESWNQYRQDRNYALFYRRNGGPAAPVRFTRYSAP